MFQFFNFLSINLAAVLSRSSYKEIFKLVELLAIYYYEANCVSFSQFFRNFCFITVIYSLKNK